MNTMSGSCHLDRASNIEIGVEHQIFLLLSFLTSAEFYNLGHIQGLTQKRKFLVLCNTLRSDFHVG